MPRRAWYLILAELAVILFLASSLVMEYFYNVYFHNYVDSLSPILIPLASVAFGVSSATIAVRLYKGTRRIQTAQETGVPVRRRSRSLRTRRKTLTLTSPPQNPTTSAPVDASKKKPESKPDRKPAPAAASPPKPAAPPSPAGTLLPPRVQPEKEAKPHSDKSG